jgi:very-short-patch-repair endonuclease
MIKQHSSQLRRLMTDAEQKLWRRLRTQQEGWAVLRFWNHEVLQDIGVVLSVIEQYCHRHPSLLHGK